MPTQSDLKKRRAGQAAFSYVRDTILPQVDGSNLWLGVGSGTTVRFFVDELGRALQEDSFGALVQAIPTSLDTEEHLRHWGIPARSLEDLPPTEWLPVYVDGADEVDHNGRALKGLGGALAREKWVRLVAREFLLVVDDGKVVDTLGGHNSPVVCEVVPFGVARTIHRLLTSDPKPTKAVLRHGSGKLGPVVTDNGNLLLDLYYEPAVLGESDLESLEGQLRTVPGVVETGLFALTGASRSFVGTVDGVVQLDYRRLEEI